MRKIIIPIIVFLFLISFVLSVDEFNVAYSHWDLENNLLDTGNLNKDLSGNQFIFSDDIVKVENYSTFNENRSSYLNVSDLGLSTTDRFSVGCWFYKQSISGYNEHLISIGENSYQDITIMIDPTGNVKLYKGGSTIIDTGYDMDLNVWTHITMLKYTNDKIRFYLNGTYIAETTYSATLLGDNLIIGHDNRKRENLEGFMGYIDNCYFINDSITTDNITDILMNLNYTEVSTTNNTPPNITLITDNNTITSYTAFSFLIRIEDKENNTLDCNVYINSIPFGQEFLFRNITGSISLNTSIPYGNNTIYYTCSDGEYTDTSDTYRLILDNVKPTITLISPENNKTTNNESILIYYNVSDLTLDNCSLLVFGNTNHTDLNLSTSYNYFNLSLSDEGYYNYSVYCNDKASNENTSEEKQLIYDFSTPIITLYSPIASASYDEEKLMVRFTLTDNYDLYYYYYNLTNLFSYNEDYSENSTISGVSYNYLDYINISGLIPYNYRFCIETCDSHTDTYLKEADFIENTNKSLRFIFDDLEIKLLPEQETIKSTYLKKKDRYSFNFDFKDKSLTSKKIKIETNGNIEYLPYSKYKAHFVIDNEYWLDFEQEDNVKVSIGEDGYYYVEIFSRNKELSFNSIGKLNCKSECIDIEIAFESSTNYSASNYELAIAITFILLFIILYIMGEIFFPAISVLAGIGFMIYSFITPIITLSWVRLIFIIIGLFMMARGVAKFFFGEN